MPTMIPKNTLSFREFVRLSGQQRKALGRMTIVPPQLGKPGFGCVVAEKPAFFQRVFKHVKLRRSKDCLADSGS